MNKLCQVIMAHSEAGSIFNRHLPIWLKQGGDLIVMCPQDAVLVSPYPTVAFGTRSHHSAMANHRFKALFAFLRNLRHTHFVIHEYDSVILDPPLLLESDNGIHSNLFSSNEPQFTGHHFLHPPLSCSSSVLGAISEALGALPDDCELGFWDRMLGLACESGNIEMKPWGPLGFSKNTIEPYDIPAAVAARKAGARCFHGVKSEAALNAILAV